MGKADTTALETPRGARTGKPLSGDRGVVIGFRARGRECTSFNKHLLGCFKHWAPCWETIRSMTPDLREHPV